jgi:hypothetical protein
MQAVGQERNEYRHLAYFSGSAIRDQRHIVIHSGVRIFFILEVSDTVHLFSMDERKTNLMHLLYIFIVAV